jgi:enoyl-CoA hydratase/carnithine racemase
VSAGGDSFRNLRCEVSDGLAVVTVDRPKVLNALDAQTVRELGDCIGALETRDDVAVIALTGAGEKAFIAGADMRPWRAWSSQRRRPPLRHARRPRACASGRRRSIA